MALQIWLPLTKNSLNYGVHPSNVTVSNATQNANGKLGGCYSFNGTSSYIYGTQTVITNNTDNWSFACWMRLNVVNTTQTLFSCRNSVNPNGITIFYSNGYWLIDDGVRWQPTNALSTNTWYHVCIIRKKDVGKYLYINGALVSSTTMVGTQTTVNSANFAIGLCHQSASAFSGNPLNGYLNDVRFYDHALSVAEIKELAKGLVCHYKLDEFYSADNLIINGFGELGTENWNNGSYISTTEIPPNHPEIKASMHSGNMTKQYIPIIQNHTYTISGYIKAMSGTTGKAYPSIYGYDIDKKFIDYHKCEAGFNSTYRTTLAQPLHKGDTVIYATDLSAWTTGDNHFYHVAIFGYQNSLGDVYPDMVYTQDSPVFGTKTDKSHINKTNNTITLNAAFTGEDRPAGTTICQATEGSVYLYPWGGIDVSTIQDWVFKTANFKPSTSSRLKAAAYIRWSTYGRCYIAGNKLVDMVASDDTIIDSSGYGYHATKSGNLSISYDSARYNISTNFSNSGYIINSAFNLKSNEFTINLWVNPRTTSKQHFLFGSFSTWPNNGLGVYRDAGSNTRYQCVMRSDGESTYSAKTMTVTLNTWNMLTITYSGTVYTGYVNGEKSFEVTYGANGIVSHYNIMIGNSKYNSTPASENEEALVSDFRLYATCLSADDIKRLYEVSASVSKNGAMLGYEMKEG